MGGELVIAAAPYLIWGVVLHLIADWPLQNEWMAQNKAKRRPRWLNGRKLLEMNEAYSGSPLTHTTEDGPWWDRHPATYVHSGIHTLIQLLVFPWWAALFIGVTHLLIDTRKPVEWWSKKIGQTQPRPMRTAKVGEFSGIAVHDRDAYNVEFTYEAFDVGMEVRFWTDQVFHIAIVATAALGVVVFT